MIPALMWGFAQQRFVVSSQRFGTTYQFHLDRSSNPGRTEMFSRNVGKQLLFYAA